MKGYSLLTGELRRQARKGPKYERGKKTKKNDQSPILFFFFLCPNRFGRCPLAKETWFTGKWTVDKKKKGAQSSYIAEQ